MLFCCLSKRFECISDTIIEKKESAWRYVTVRQWIQQPIRMLSRSLRMREIAMQDTRESLQLWVSWQVWLHDFSNILVKQEMRRIQSKEIQNTYK